MQRLFPSVAGLVARGWSEPEQRILLGEWREEVRVAGFEVGNEYHACVVEDEEYGPLVWVGHRLVPEGYLREAATDVLFVRGDEQVAVEGLLSPDRLAYGVEPLGEGRFGAFFEIDESQGHLEQRPRQLPGAAGVHRAAVVKLEPETVGAFPDALLAVRPNVDVLRRRAPPGRVPQLGLRHLAGLRRDAVLHPKQGDGTELDEGLIELGEHLIVALVAHHANRQHDVLVTETLRHEVLDARELPVFPAAVQAGWHQDRAGLGPVAVWGVLASMPTEDTSTLAPYHRQQVRLQSSATSSTCACDCGQ